AKAALALALFLLIGGAAYKIFFQRTGEQAIQLIPSNALVVITIDTAPSPQQIGLWQRIQGALDREGLSSKIDKAISSIPDQSWPATIRTAIDKSIAVAVIDPKLCNVKQDPGVVVYLAIKDEGKVRETLKKEFETVSGQGMDCYRSKD